MRLHRSPPPRPALQRRTPRPWDPPQTEFPGIVPLTLPLGRSGQAAIAITGLSAYRNGFTITVTALIHPDAPGFDAGPPGGGVLAYRPCLISLLLSDGRTVTSDRPHGDSEPSGPILRPRGGGGTSHCQQSSWWAWPLPPGGPLEFICDWPAPGTGETRASIDAQVILDVALQSIPVWPGSED